MNLLRLGERANDLASMKELRLLSPRGLLVLSYCTSIFMLDSSLCEANLGDTPEQIKTRYGEVIYRFESGGTFRFRRPGVDTDTVDVTFQDGTSQREAFNHWKSKDLTEIDSTGSFSKADIESVLKANAQDLTWRKQPPGPKDLLGTSKWLLGSNDPKTAVAKAVSNNEHHSLVVMTLTYDWNRHMDSATVATLDALFPAPTKTPEAVRVPVPLKTGMFPVLKILGQPQSTVSKLLGKPSNHRPIHKPDKLAGGEEVEYPDGTNWKHLSTAFYRDKACWIYFFFREPLPASENDLFDVLGLSKTAFRRTSENGRETEYRGVADKRVMKILASHPGPKEGTGFCVIVDIELIETLD